jgi:2-oxo-3-hexenedioate decarboxylase/2-keto-4-pentenoate hydratase
MSLDVRRIARELQRQHRDHEDFQAPKTAFGIATLSDAYDVQDEFVARRAAETGAARAGYKIGLTTARMQAFCGIDHPIAGVVLADRVGASGAVLDPKSFGRLGIEFEICVRLGRDLPGGELPYMAGPDRLGDVAAAVDSVCAAVEVIDDRNADYAALDAISIVADNSWNAGIVLGPFRSPDLDLAAAAGTATRNGEAIGTGTGADVLGHPLAALAWLAYHLSRRGGQLRAGDLVMTGSMVTTRFPAAGEHYRFDVAGLAAVEVAIA